jgi:hypothetical protein
MYDTRMYVHACNAAIVRSKTRYCTHNSAKLDNHDNLTGVC